jgi:hypothetical protein
MLKRLSKGEKKMKRCGALVAAALMVFSFAFSVEKGKKIYVANHINPHPPTIDGQLDDPVWQRGEWESGFIQRKPYEGQEPSQKTAFKILYDEKNIYVAIQAFDTEPRKIERRMSRRDDFEGDWVGIEIDSYYDQRTAFCFSVNAAGVKADQVISDDGENEDPNWDPIWYVKTDTDEKGWNAEMRIPLSQLRYGNKVNQVWGLQLTRVLFRKEETSHWQFIPRDSSGWVSQFGRLEGIENIKAQRQVELYPYTVANAQTFQGEAGNPFATGRLSQFMGGLDGKIGVTSDLTLNFTVNPDFGQVEADPSEVNLTAFETYFEEKRPFFIEGRNILNFRLMLGDGDFSDDNLFYTRRIGGRPHHSPSTVEDEYVDVPQNTSILGAFKLTGKTKNGLSIGVIESITSRERADISFLGKMRQETVEPLTNYFGLRLQKDYNRGNTLIGAMVTATNRNIEDTQLNFLHSAAYTGGLDFYHTWKNRTYYIQGNTVFSHVRGSKEAILETQMSPLRYFQRPDAGHVTLDPNRTSLSGFGGTLVGGKLGGGSLKYVGGFTFRSPGFELNDMGYLRDADKIMQFIWAGYNIYEPFSVFRNFNFNFNQWMGWDFSGEQIFSGGNFGVYGQFKNYYTFNVSINRNDESLAKSLLRGGPSLRWPGRWSPYFDFGTDSRKKLRFHAGSWSSFSDDGNSKYLSCQAGFSYRPSGAVSISVIPSYDVNKQELQYVETTSLGDEDRYIFGRIDQKTLAVTLRFNISLTPDLSIQFYGQPFVSAGDYTEFKHITDSRARNYDDRFYTFMEKEISFNTDSGVYSIDENRDGTADYSFENPNFNFLQFRSNLVLRWEYRPGSVLFLVWSQGRTGVLSNGDFSYGNDLRSLFDIHPHNVFLVKFSYGFRL